MTRRSALLLPAFASAQTAPLPPITDLANTFELAAAARSRLSASQFSAIAGSDRSAFDRITLRPRMMVNGYHLNLAVELFGESHFAPILAGPATLLTRFHPQAHAEWAAGVTGAKALGVVAIDGTEPAAGSYWRQIAATGPVPASEAKAFVVTLDGNPFPWTRLDQIAAKASRPVVVKGVQTVESARRAIEHGAAGIVVSNYRAGSTRSLASPILALPGIVDAVGAKAPVLVDGGFRRGTDVLKALALGAKAVLVCRPVLWGLAGYGAAGVRFALEQLQTELARDMVMCGINRPQDASPAHVRIHRDEKHL